MKKELTPVFKAQSRIIPVLFIMITCIARVFSQEGTLHLNYQAIKTEPHDTTLAKIDQWVKKLNGQHVDISVIGYYNKVEFRKYAQQRCDELFLVLNRKAR